MRPVAWLTVLLLQLSQDKPAEDAARVVAALDRTGHGDLAAAMRHRLTPTPTEDDT